MPGLLLIGEIRSCGLLLCGVLGVLAVGVVPQLIPDSGQQNGEEKSEAVAFG